MFLIDDHDDDEGDRVLQIPFRVPSLLCVPREFQKERAEVASFASAIAKDSDRDFASLLCHG